jgi:predicted RNase H-like HicB family nuclease
MTMLITTTAQINTSEILKKPYARRLVRDEAGGYTASIQEFPGCVAEGDTAEEALRNLDEAAASWIEVSLLNGREIREPIDFEGCSGKIALRIPRGLHKQVAELAEMEGSSINQLLATAIASYVSGKQVLHRVTEVLQNTPPSVRHYEINAILTLSANMGQAVVRKVGTTSGGPIPLSIHSGSFRRMATNIPQLISETAHG